jgi:hypothetical protein
VTGEVEVEVEVEVEIEVEIGVEIGVEVEVEVGSPRMIGSEPSDKESRAQLDSRDPSPR